MKSFWLFIINDICNKTKKNFFFFCHCIRCFTASFCERSTSIDILNQLIKQKRDAFNRNATNKYSGDIFRKPGALAEAYEYAYQRFQKLSDAQAEVVDAKKEKYDNALKSNDPSLINRALN